MSIYVKFWLFLQCPLSKYGHVTKQILKTFYFFLLLHLILGQVTTFLVEKRSTSEVISQKPHGGWPSAFRVKQKSSSSFHMLIYARSEQCDSGNSLICLKCDEKVEQQTNSLQKL